VLNLDAMEGSGRLERGDHETTITTDVAGAELTTRTGHEYSQIPRTHAETEFEESEETSRKYVSTVAPNETAEPEEDYEDEDLETDLRESRAFDDVIIGEQEVNTQESVATAAPLSDVRHDQPTSSQEICRKEVQPTEPSLQEVLVETTGLRPEEHAMGTDTPASANVHDETEPTIQEEEMQFDNMGTPIPESDTSMDENWLTLPSATIDCPTVSEPAPIGRISQASPNERQRPATTANRPPRYRDSSFETHFQPVPRRHCRKIQKQNSTGHNNINVEGYQDVGRGENITKVTPTGNENARQKQHFRLETSRHPCFIANLHPDPTKGLLATSQSLKNNRRRYLHEDKGRIKSPTLPYPPMNAKDVESSIKTLPTHQKRSRTAHLQLKSTARLRVSTDYLSAMPRGSNAAPSMQKCIVLYIMLKRPVVL